MGFLFTNSAQNSGTCFQKRIYRCNAIIFEALTVLKDVLVPLLLSVLLTSIEQRRYVGNTHIHIHTLGEVFIYWANYQCMKTILERL